MSKAIVYEVLRTGSMDGAGNAREVGEEGREWAATRGGVEGLGDADGAGLVGPNSKRGEGGGDGAGVANGK